MSRHLTDIAPQPNDKRSGALFGEAVAVDDDTGTIVVGSYLQSVTRPDWDLPGSVADVALGVFGSEFSFRADGGINNGDGPAQGSWYSVWTHRFNPYLRNVGTSRGGRGGVGVDDWSLVYVYRCTVRW